MQRVHAALEQAHRIRTEDQETIKRARDFSGPLQQELWAARNYSHCWGTREEWTELLLLHPTLLSLPVKDAAGKVLANLPSWSPDLATKERKARPVALPSLGEIERAREQLEPILREQGIDIDEMIAHLRATRGPPASAAISRHATGPATSSPSLAPSPAPSTPAPSSSSSSSTPLMSSKPTPSTTANPRRKPAGSVPAPLDPLTVYPKTGY